MKQQVTSTETIARAIAHAAHARQVEELTGDPYIRHVERVVALMGDREDCRVVAWLHDVIEDTDMTAEDLLLLDIPPNCVDAITLLTRDSEKENYAEYIERIRNSENNLAIEVKIADLRDHLRQNCPPSMHARYERALARLLPARHHDIGETA